MNLKSSAFNLIQKQYEQQIKRPKEKPARQFLLCPVGLVAAGKTTVIKPLAKKLNLVRISSDGIRKILKNNNYNFDRVHGIVFTICEKYLNQGFSIAIDADCVDAKKVKKIENIAGKFQAKIFWIHINPPEKFIIEKIKRHKPTWLFPNKNIALRCYKIRKRLHQRLNFDFIYSFDTSKNNINKQIKEASLLIQKKLKKI